jgi:ethanolamine utilization protein EutQ (cupin superfamily)
MPLLYKPAAEGYEVKQQAIPSPGNNSFLGDIFTTPDVPVDQKISSGFYTQYVGEPLVYTYTYDEAKVNLFVSEGAEFYVSDVTTKVQVKPHDVLHFTKGTTITFEVIGPEGSYAKNFFVGLRDKDAV